MTRFWSIFEFFVVFGGLGGLEWSKMVRGTRTIILVPLIPHIDHSRPISTPFWHFLESPIPAYFCQNPPRGAISHLLNLRTCKSMIFLASIGFWASKFAFDGYGFSAKRIHGSRVIHLSVRKPKNLAKSRGAVFFTNTLIFLPKIDFVFSVHI